MKNLRKILKSNKGFTLIELIVVIAILAILAAIAIPRFSGFTDKAKIGNDEQYAALVANATMVLAAEGAFTYTQGQSVVITLTPTTGAVSNVTVGGTALSAAALDTYNTEIEKLVALTPAQYYTATWSVTADDSGVQSVTGTK